MKARLGKLVRLQGHGRVAARHDIKISRAMADMSLRRPARRLGICGWMNTTHMECQFCRTVVALCWVSLFLSS